MKRKLVNGFCILRKSSLIDLLDKVRVQQTFKYFIIVCMSHLYNARHANLFWIALYLNNDYNIKNEVKLIFEYSPF